MKPKFTSKLKFGWVAAIFLLVNAVLLFFLINPSSEKSLSSKVSFGDKINFKTADTGVAIENLSGSSIASERAVWSTMMDKEGPESAYEKFKERYRRQDFGIQHIIAHVIGELIYQKKGLPGMVVCDSTFSFGCYHSFYGQALVSEGLSIIPVADKFCIDKFGPLGTGCQHGIGHGLMDFFGPEKLVLALEACSMTTQQKKLFGCTAGVFMEYNVPIVLSAENSKIEPRVLNKKNPYAPCTEVPEKYQESCYHEMPQWWDKSKVFDKDYKKIGELCQAIVSSTSKESCFLGTGNVAAPSSNYVVADTISKCNQMPTTDSKVTCQSSASWSFFSSITYRSLSEQVCANLDDVTRQRCVKKSDLIGIKSQ